MCLMCVRCCVMPVPWLVQSTYGVQRKAHVQNRGGEPVVQKLVV